MPFCTGCGAESHSGFCPACGLKSSQASTQAVPPTGASIVGPPVAKPGAPWMKVLLVLGVLVVCGIAALAYGAYWVKNKVVSTAAEHGLTIPQESPAKNSGGLFSRGAKSRSGAPMLDTCSLIGQEDADAVIGEPSKRTEHQENDSHSSHCHYSAAEPTHAANGFEVEIHNNEDASEARSGQAIKRGIYSNVSLYAMEELSNMGDGGFVAVSKAPEGEAFKSGPLASMVARQQVLMIYKGSKDVEIIVSYFGPEHTTEALQTMSRKLADQI
jgi:hypothetical protein